eukprot:5937114-Pyramimonas_sp.AAC.2
MFRRHLLDGKSNVGTSVPPGFGQPVCRVSELPRSSVKGCEGHRHRVAAQRRLVRPRSGQSH